MSKTAVLAKITAKAGQRDALRAELAKMFPVVAEEAGTQAYVLHDDLGDADTVWMYELYVDDEALAVHSGSAAMAEMFTSLAGLVAEPPMLVLARPVEAKGLDLGS